MASAVDAVARYVRTPKAVGLAVATVLAVAAAYATAILFVSSQLAFLSMVVLGVSVPTTLESYGLLPATATRTVPLVVGACLVHWAVFLALYVAAVAVASDLVAAAVAFVVTVLAGAVVGRSLQGPGTPD